MITHTPTGKAVSITDYDYNGYRGFVKAEPKKACYFYRGSLTFEGGAKHEENVRRNLDKRKARLARKTITLKHPFSIRTLREMGCKVRTMHLRRAWDAVTQKVIVVPTNLRNYYTFSERGGQTHLIIDLVNPPIDEMIGSRAPIHLNSVCSDDDNFCYQDGVIAALNRLDKIELHELSQLALEKSKDEMPPPVRVAIP